MSMDETSGKPARQKYFAWQALLPAICNEKKFLMLYTSADPSYCIITQETQIFMQSLTFRIMKYSPTRNCLENHVTRLTLHFLIRQDRPCQQN